MSDPRNKPVNPRRVSYARNPMYVFYALLAVLIYLVCWLYVSRQQIGFFERNLFHLIYGLPGYLIGLFVVSLVVGIIGTMVGVVVFGFVRKRYDIIFRTFFAVFFSSVIAVLLSGVVHRGQPSDLLPDVTQRLGTSSLGFPAAIMAIITAAVLTLALYAPNWSRRWVKHVLAMVGVSLVYLAINLPVDVVGGYAVGLFSFSLCSLAFGSVFHPIDIEKLMGKLKAGGMKGIRLKPASVDARGSVPFFGSYDKGPVFVKVFNQDNNAADWLFKLTRRVRFRRLEDEVPSLTPKRAIEHEAYMTLLAKYFAGANVPELIGVFKVAQNTYAMVTERIDAYGLDSLDSSKITDDMLLKTWKEINKLHDARIIHKDLRAANIMIEKSTGLPWIIDFGFSESAVDKRSFYKDTVEFIASSATKVGAKRAVKAALTATSPEDIKLAAPYMQFSALSGATTTQLKQRPGLLEEIKAEMSDVIRAPKK